MAPSTCCRASRALVAYHYRAAEWHHKEVEPAAHDLLQRLDERASS